MILFLFSLKVDMQHTVGRGTSVPLPVRVLPGGGEGESNL